MVTNELQSLTFTALDTETSGAYPVGFEIIEFAAIKFTLDKEIARQSFLIRPLRPMTDESIAIHNITPEMLANEKTMPEVAKDIAEFLRGTHTLAHHAPFDMGFLSYVFEKQNLPPLTDEGFCTSLLARTLITEVENHRLQTLARHFQFPPGQAHRAYDDAEGCHLLFGEILRRLTALYPARPLTLQDLVTHQGKRLLWSDYRLQIPSYPWMKTLIQACETSARLEIHYQKKSTEAETRVVQPLGVVRNPDGDYCSAICSKDGQRKRFYLTKIKEAALLA